MWPERLGHIPYRGEGGQSQAQEPRKLPGGHLRPILLPTSHFTTSCRRGSSYHEMWGAVHQGMETCIAVKWGECLDYTVCSVALNILLVVNICSVSRQVQFQQKESHHHHFNAAFCMPGMVLSALSLLPHLKLK